MNDDKKTHIENTQANDDVSHNAHYDKDGKPSQFDERDLNESADDWNAEQSRTGRHK